MLLHLAKVKQDGGELGLLLFLEQFLLEFLELAEVSFLHGIDLVLTAVIVLLALFVPVRCELLVLEHVGLLHPEPFPMLLGLQGLLFSVRLVRLELIVPLFCHIRFNIFALLLTILPVFLKNCKKVGYSRLLCLIHRELYI